MQLRMMMYVELKKSAVFVPYYYVVFFWFFLLFLFFYFFHICVHTVTICKSYKYMTLGDFGFYIGGLMFLIYALLRHAVCTNKLLCAGQTPLHLTYNCWCCVEISRFNRLIYDVYLQCYRPKLDCCICHRQSM